MNHYPTLAFWLMALVLVIGLSGIKRNYKRRLFLMGICAWVICIPLFFPRKWWGVWDATKDLKGKPISRILLLPSTPDWDVNLTDTVTLISDTGEIHEILGLLRKTDVYIPGHPLRIWETKLIFVTSGNDSIPFKIQRTENNGTDIYAPNDEWRKDELGPYLEKIVKYRGPVRAK